MSLNKGGKHQKSKKNSSKRTTFSSDRELVFADNANGVEQYYATTGKAYGGTPMIVPIIFSENDKVAKARAGDKRKCRIDLNGGQTVLVEMRDESKDKWNIVHVYKPEEVNLLKNYGELKKDKVSKESSSDFEFEDL
jgi:translation initiation factor IF-1